MFQVTKAKMKKKRFKKNHGKTSRRKGHQFERDVAILFRGLFPNARRHLEYQDAEANGIDLVNTGPYKIQCKKLKKYSSLSAIKEIQCDTLFGDIPVLITQGDGEVPLAALPLSHFLELLDKQKLKSEK